MNMSKKLFAIQNPRGQTVRVIPSSETKLEVIYRHDLRRIELARETKELQQEGIKFDKLADIAKTCPIGGVVAKGPWGQIQLVNRVEQIAPDTEERKEENRDFIYFIKWTAAIQITSLIFIMAIGWWIQSRELPEPQVVTVFRRQDISLPKKVPIVRPSPTKIKNISRQAQVTKKNVKVKKPRKIVLNNSHKKSRRNTRAGNNLNSMGALSALGGMSKDSTGPGGLSKSSSKSGGYGFDSSRARGGSDRGLLGKGMIQAGIGGGENLKGYGGYGTNGKGSGQAGYGSAKIAGRSGGYYLPLSEEAYIGGGLERDQVQAVVERNQGQMTYCYERGLQSDVNLGGRVSIKFVISPQGRVSSAQVARSTLSSSQVENCLLNKLRAWRFPKPRGNVAVKVDYPFLFRRLNQG
ncbi:MAG: TonB family protein [Bdellovibrionales bacterium]|nr:TonB family protein [Bdellovibrionales bacterium]